MTRSPGSPAPLSPPSPHVPFVASGLAIAILGGFVLGIALPLSGPLGIPAARWVGYAQLHGHLQAVGFVGLVIVGVSYRLVPNFAGAGALRFPRLVPWSLWLIGGGVVVRGVGQLAAEPPFGVLVALGAWAEVAGGACFALNVVRTAWPSLARDDVSAPFLVAGASWFMVQATLGAWWLTVAAVAGDAALPAARDGVLVFLQFFAFHLMFILGVGTRSFPVFFGMGRLTFRAVALPFALAQAGLVLHTAGVLAAPALAAAVAWRVQDAGMLLVAAGLAWVAARTGWWRPPSRIRPASRSFAHSLQPALAWLTLACALAAFASLRAFAAGTLPAAHELDAVRHMVAVGVVLTTIVAMAQMVLPEFASERFGGRQGGWRGIALAAVLSLATALRAGARLVSGLPAGLSQTLTAFSGVLALSVMVVFAALFVRGLRHHRALLARFEAFAAAGQVWTFDQPPPPQEPRD